MTVKKIKSKDILGDNYYTYKLTSSNYTPNLNTSITISCIVKNIYGDTIANKSLQLSQNDTVIGTATTNNNGVATWTVTCSTAGVQKFSVADIVIEVFVDTTSKTGHTHTVSNITDFPTLSNVATSGNYNDLNNKPSIPSDVSELTDTQNTQFTPKTHSHSISNVTNLQGTLNDKLEISDLLDLIYPIGSIYMEKDTTTHSVCPIQTRLGGTWTRIENRFLYASENGQGLNNTGGEETHTLTVNEIPSHTHTQDAHTHSPSRLGSNFVPNKGLSRGRATPSSSGNMYVTYLSSSDDYIWEGTGSTTATNQNTGGGQAHNNMPPYIIVNVWERTA